MAGPTRRYVDHLVDQEHRFSLSTEPATDQHHLAVAVSAPLVDYELRYQLTAGELAALLADHAAAVALAERCRAGLEDARLLA